MCIVTLTTVLGSTFAAVGTALGASASAAAAVGATAVIGADVALTAALAGGIATTASAISQAQMAQEQAEYQEQVARDNAKLAAIEAEQIELQGNQERSQLRLKALTSRGAARAGYAAGGVVLGRGTPNDMEADIMDAYDLDKRNLNYDIATRSWQARVQSANFNNQANLYSAQAKAYGQQKSTSLINGIFDTTADVAGTAVSLVSMGSTLKDAGVFSKLDFGKKTIDDPLTTDLAYLT